MSRRPCPICGKQPTFAINGTYGTTWRCDAPESHAIYGPGCDPHGTGWDAMVDAMPSAKRIAGLEAERNALRAENADLREDLRLCRANLPHGNCHECKGTAVAYYGGKCEHCDHDGNTKQPDDRRCGTCKWATEMLGRSIERCDAPIPDSAGRCDGEGMFIDDGEYCPCWARRDG